MKTHLYQYRYFCIMRENTIDNSQKKRIARVLERLQKGGIAVSLFLDPEEAQIKAGRETGAEMIELHTGRYANASSESGNRKEYLAIARSAKFAKAAGLKVFAGHGLHYGNVKPLLAIKEIEEYNIGHSIVARAVFVGLGNAVREMKALLR